MPLKCLEYITYSFLVSDSQTIERVITDTRISVNLSNYLATAITSKVRSRVRSLQPRQSLTLSRLTATTSTGLESKYYDVYIVIFFKSVIRHEGLK